MTYRVEVDWAPAYELVISLQAYVNKPDRKILEMGATWLKKVRQSLPPAITAELMGFDALETMAWLDLLVRQCPGERGAADFVRWLATISTGELYERMAPYALDGGVPLPRDAGALREQSVSLLTAWHDHYFSRVDPAILEGLANDAAATRACVDTMPPYDLVECATNGVWYRPQPPPEVVVLIPQYHYRPWNIFSEYRGMRVIHYPVDALPPAAGAPAPALLRLTRALDDESRLRILRFLAAGPQNFTSVVKATGLAKSTIHHHMVVLRAAGLVRVHETGNNAPTYSLRPHAVDDLGDKLDAFLRPE